MDRQHRRDLKHDAFVDEVGALTVRARENQRLLFMIAGAVVAIAVIVAGIAFYRGNREKKAQNALAEAISTFESPLIPAPNATPPQPTPPNAKFKTEAERTAAAEKQFKAVYDTYHGSDAADVAGLYLARITSGKGDVAGSRKLLEEFVDNQPKHLLVGGAHYSLLQMRIDNGEAQNVINEINAEIAKEEPVLPTDALLALQAKAYETQGDVAKMKEAFRRIITEYPDSPYVLDAQRRAGPA
jgi:tetratricopeptide (TPR) repeat protein